MASHPQRELFPQADSPPGLAHINGRCLLQTLGEHYRRAEDEGRTLVQTALASAADLVVTDTELRVVLAPMSSAHRTRAVAALCQEINAGATTFPGSKLRLRFSVAEPA